MNRIARVVVRPFDVRDSSANARRCPAGSPPRTAPRSKSEVMLAGLSTTAAIHEFLLSLPCDCSQRSPVAGNPEILRFIASLESASAHNREARHRSSLSSRFAGATDPSSPRATAGSELSRRDAISRFFESSRLPILIRRSIGKRDVTTMNSAIASHHGCPLGAPWA
jgi:hypothetical protein